jgi:trimethylamine--corrinoid protein Co-methyltransferase
MSDQARSALESALELEQSHDFEQAKGIYADILANAADEEILEKARWRMEDMDALIAEKTVYQRIDENGKRVLTDIGMNIAENQTLMDILMEADAIDFDNETAIFIPLKRDYIE